MGVVNDTSLTEQEREFIREAAAFLENPGAFVRTVAGLGKPIEALQDRLPERANQAISRIARISIERALGLAIRSIGQKSPEEDAGFVHSAKRARVHGTRHLAASALSGALGGGFGLMALPLELPISTALMLRSIAKIAADFGVDLSDPSERLECLYIFTLGTPSPDDDEAETGYYASRLGFNQILRGAATYVAANSSKEILRALESGGAPALAHLIAKIAARFQVAVTQKTVASVSYTHLTLPTNREV